MVRTPVSDGVKREPTPPKGNQHSARTKLPVQLSDAIAHYPGALARAAMCIASMPRSSSFCTARLCMT
jgi:hypothetical protein